MIELTHAIAVYRKRLANGGPDYSGKWVLIQLTEDRFEFSPFDTEAQATDALDATGRSVDALIFQLPYDEVS